MTMPVRAGGGYGSNSNQHNNQHFIDSDIKELSYDIGVDPRILKFQIYFFQSLILHFLKIHSRQESIHELEIFLNEVFSIMQMI